MSARHGIHVIDTGFVRPRMDASCLVVEKGRGAFINCGVNHSVPRLLAGLGAAGLAPADVDWLILTHVHLDHAGGAGELMRHLPHARLAVHPRGARHMIDPSRLWAGATAVYGQTEMERSYGQLVPVAAERVVPAPDGFEIDLAGRRLVCLDTPGHARHHNAIHDPASGCVFSGDTFGASYRELDTERGPFIMPATTPAEFEPADLHRSIDRLVTLEPLAIYLTHYGPVVPIAPLARELHHQIDAMVDIAMVAQADASGGRHRTIASGLHRLYNERARANGWRGNDAWLTEFLMMDVELNAYGLEAWLDRGNRT